MSDIFELTGQLSDCVDAAGLPAEHSTALKVRLQQAALEHTFFKTVINALPDVTFLRDEQRRYVFVNQATAQWLGVKNPNDLIGKSTDELFDTLHAEQINEEDRQILAGGDPIVEKYESARSSNGLDGWVSVTKLLITEPSGSRRYVAGYRREVSDQKKTEDFLHDIVSHARCILWTARVKKVDREFKWQVNVLSSRIARFELGMHEDSNELWSGLASDKDLRLMHETSTHALRRNASGYENEFTIQGLDGSVRNLREVVRITPVSTTEWDLVGVAMDVTEQEQAEIELQKSLSIVSATVESTEDGVLVVNRQGEIVFFNSRFAELWGIPEHIILSCDDSRSLDFAMNLLVDPDSFIKRVEEAYAQPEAIFYDILKFKDGRVFERHSHPQRSGAENSGRVWVFRDISKRTRMEEQLA
ncbi:MAG: PAS domain S-box protein, partial [Planctomycetota bacterium]